MAVREAEKTLEQVMEMVMGAYESLPSKRNAGKLQTGKVILIHLFIVQRCDSPQTLS